MESPLQQLRPTQLNEMVIGSVDTLRGKEINQTIPNTWNDKPPLLNKVGRNGVVVEETENLLKGMIRQGIPPALRCAIQLSNIIQRIRLLVSSSAAIGGPATAVALATEAQWKSLMVPSLIIGNIGYAIATFCGLVFHSYYKP